MNLKTDPTGQQGLAGWTSGEGFELWAQGRFRPQRDRRCRTHHMGCESRQRDPVQDPRRRHRTLHCPHDRDHACRRRRHLRCDRGRKAQRPLRRAHQLDRRMDHPHPAVHSTLPTRVGRSIDFNTHEMYALLWNLPVRMTSRCGLTTSPFGVCTLRRRGVRQLTARKTATVTSSRRTAALGHGTYNDGSTGGWQTPKNEPLVPTLVSLHRAHRSGGLAWERASVST